MQEYKINGKYLTTSELIEYVKAEAQKIDDITTRKAYLDIYNNLLNYNMEVESRKDFITTLLIPSVGLILLIGIIILAYFNPAPSSFQSGIYWIALSVGASACAAVIPGFFEIKYKTALRATGAVAVFVLMYISKPAIMKNQELEKNSKLNLFVANTDTSNIQKISVDFDPNSSTNFCSFTKESLLKYFGKTVLSDTFICFRKSDGKIYSDENCRDINEYDAIIISAKLGLFYKNQRDTYIHFIKLTK